MLIQLIGWLGMAAFLISYQMKSNRILFAFQALCAASPCWIICDVLIGSWGGVANEAFTIVSILVSIVRFGWKALFEDNKTGEENEDQQE